MAEASRRGGAEVIDPVAWLCPGGICPVATDRGPVFRDISHLRPYYVREHAGFIDDIISAPVRRDR
jgi:hypothetical protein